MQRQPPLDEAGYARSRAHVRPHDHAVCAYARPEDLAASLGAFIREGIERRELSVFVHSFQDEAEAWQLLERAYPGASQLRTDQLIVVNLYRDAFEGSKGRIDYEHVKGVVDSLVDAARGRGREGVRIFVDASRVYLGGGRMREWFDFEAWLGPKLQASVGLVCAYQQSDIMRSDILPEVLRTHAYRFAPADA